MTPSTYPTRLIRMLALGAIVAGTIASAANALPVVDNDGRSAQASFSTPQGLKADGLRLQGIAQVYKQLQPDTGFPTAQGLKADGLRMQGIAQVYKQLQPDTGFPTAQGLKADGLRMQGIAQVYEQSQPVPDVLERYATAHPYGVGSPAAQSPSDSSGFNWGDWAIGIGSGMGLILVLATGLAMAWQRRHRVQTA